MSQIKMKKTRIYAEQLDDQALEQFNSAMEQDFSIQGALMADAHHRIIRNG